MYHVHVIVYANKDYNCYCQEAMDHISDYLINKFKVAFCSVSIYTHVGWYRIVFKAGYVPSI